MAHIESPATGSGHCASEESDKGQRKLVLFVQLHLTERAKGNVAGVGRAKEGANLNSFPSSFSASRCYFSSLLCSCRQRGSLPSTTLDLPCKAGYPNPRLHPLPPLALLLGVSDGHKAVKSLFASCSLLLQHSQMAPNKWAAAPSAEWLAAHGQRFLLRRAEDGGGNFAVRSGNKLKEWIQR